MSAGCLVEADSFQGPGGPSGGALSHWFVLWRLAGPQGSSSSRGASPVPLPQAPFPPATLTLGQVTAVIKIDLVSGEEGETRRPSDLRWPRCDLSKHSAAPPWLPAVLQEGVLPWGHELECARPRCRQGHVSDSAQP